MQRWRKTYSYRLSLEVRDAFGLLLSHLVNFRRFGCCSGAFQERIINIVQNSFRATTIAEIKYHENESSMRTTAIGDSYTS